MCQLARKALEQAVQEDAESDDEIDDKFLNLEDGEGTTPSNVPENPCSCPE